MDKDKLTTSLKNIYIERLEIDEIDNDNFSIFLPMFLDTGNSIDIHISKLERNKYILSNNLYIYLEEKLKRNDLIKSYLLKSTSLKEIKRAVLEKNNIAISINQEKEIVYKNEEDFANELFLYAHCIKIYFNDLYNIAKNKKPPIEREKIFLSAVENFVTNFNSSVELKLDKFQDNKEISSKNEIYLTSNNKGEKKIISNVLNERNALRTLINFNTLYGNKKYEKGILFFDMEDRSLTDSVVLEIENSLKKIGISSYKIDNANDFDDKFDEIKDKILND